MAAYFCIVRIGLSIFLTFIFLTGSVIDLHDLSKLPYMISHFQQHKNKSESFSAADFFDLHYGQKAEQHDKQEHEQHKGLPFKDHHCSSVHASIVIQRSQPSLITTAGFEISYSNFYQSTFFSSYIQSIWQPPKLA